MLVGALKERVRRQGACVFHILARHSRDENMGSPKPYLSVFFRGVLGFLHWRGAICIVALRVLVKRCERVRKKRFHRCRGLYVQNVAELRIPEHRVVCYQCRTSEPAVRARRHTGRAATVCRRESGNSQVPPKAESGDSDGLRRVQNTLLRWSVFVASHDGRQAELRLSAARVQEAPNVHYEVGERRVRRVRRSFFKRLASCR